MVKRRLRDLNHQREVRGTRIGSEIIVRAAKHHQIRLGLVPRVVPGAMSMGAS